MYGHSCLCVDISTCCGDMYCHGCLCADVSSCHSNMYGHGYLCVDVNTCRGNMYCHGCLCMDNNNNGYSSRQAQAQSVYTFFNVQVCKIQCMQHTITHRHTQAHNHTRVCAPTHPRTHTHTNTHPHTHAHMRAHTRTHCRSVSIQVTRSCRSNTHCHGSMRAGLHAGDCDGRVGEEGGVGAGSQRRDQAARRVTVDQELFIRKSFFLLVFYKL